MANIKSFPNNQDTYIDAEPVMRWLHGRTSGVFGANGNASVAAVSDAMAVTVSDGIGWLADSNGNGIAWWNDHEKTYGEKLHLNIDIADGVLNRIDRVVVSWPTTNYVDLPTISILKGTPSGAPRAPALTNNGVLRQISLARVYIPAGAISITPSMITDERLDSSVCGIVTEHVEVDTSVMDAQFRDWFNSVTGILGEDEAGKLLQMIENLTYADVGAAQNLSIGSYSGDINSLDIQLNSIAWITPDSINSPISGYGFLETYGVSSTTRFQKITAYNSGAIYYRCYANGQWYSWVKLHPLTASDVGARPSSWTPTASDVGAVADSDIFHGTGTGDLNSLKNPGIYWIAMADSTHAPETNGYGFLEVVFAYNARASDSVCVQRFTKTNSERVWVRTYNIQPQASWTDWVRIDNEESVPRTRTVNGKALSSDIALTASDVGAAPTINIGIYTGDTNSMDIPVNSVAWVTSATVNNPLGGFGFMETWGVSSTTRWQRFTAYQSRSTCSRTYTNGKWYDLVWDNPPMAAGTEYLTSEKWNGKAVYRQIVSFGTLPASGGKSVALGCAITALVAAAMSCGESDALRCLGDVVAYRKSDQKLVYSSNGSEYTGAYADVKYTKD